MNLRITARAVPAVRLLVACLGVGSAAAQWPTEPILRIDPGTHTDTIFGIDADRAGRWIVTGSVDKTARVWNAQTGSLEQVLRPPIPEWHKGGGLVSVAISPDGRLVACAQGVEAGMEATIYLFSRATAQVLATVHGLPAGDMKFSPDGRTLGVVVSGKNGGIRLFGVAGSDANGENPKSSSNGLVLDAQDLDYPGAATSLDFSPDGSKLATASEDGRIRLYDLIVTDRPAGTTLTPVLTDANVDGMPLRCIRFSPDGSKLATAYDLPMFQLGSVRSTRDLHELFKIQLRGDISIKLSYLGSIAWSSDGNSLYASGAFSRGDHAPTAWSLIQRWREGGKATTADVLIGTNDNNFVRITLLPNGLIAAVTRDGMIEALKSDGSHEWQVKSKASGVCTPNLDSCPDSATVHLSPDGRIARFTYRPDGAVPARFSLNDRTLNLTSRTLLPILSPPDIDLSEFGMTWDPKNLLERSSTKKDGIEQWDPHVYFNGQFGWSVAVAPDRHSLLVGTGISLIRCDPLRHVVWQVETPGSPSIVNISKDGRLAVAAFGDGTIRWYSYADGKELLALFPHADRKRWVLWTPSGYYDASPGGEELIGWHVNNGPDKEADFFPASRFRGVKYRPDVISRVLDTLDEGQALALADAARDKAPAKTSVADALPPVVSILSPEDGSSASTATVTVRYTVRSPSGEPVTGMRVMIDGRPVPSGAEAEPVKKDGEQSVTVTVPARDSEVSVVALNRFSASVPATIHLVWVQTATTEEFNAKPKLYLLAVGESVYDKPELRLNYAAKDARDFAAAMQAQKGGLYRDVEVKLLTDAPKEDIEDGLEWLRRQVTSRDVGVIFLAGHGVDDSSGMYYFLPANADLDRLMRTGLVFSDLKNTVQSIAGKAVMFVDTCHSGNVMGTRRGVTDINQVVNELASVENGVVVFTASTGRQFSLEDAQWQNGAFTKALVEAIGGKADYTGKGKITINMLELYLSDRVKELTNGQQTPATSKPNTVPDFPLAMRQ